MTTHVSACEAPAAAGVLFLHGVPRAMASHVEWGLARAFGMAVRVEWSDQPVAPGQVRAEIVWQGDPGTAARIASALLAFERLRFEVTEDARGGREGERFAATPALGLFRAQIGAHGDVLVPEDRLRAALRRADPALEISRLIGTPWDEELEPFRCAQDGSSVRLLHHVV
jgi:hypothetical protein